MKMLEMSRLVQSENVQEPRFDRNKKAESQKIVSSSWFRDSVSQDDKVELSAEASLGNYLSGLHSNYQSIRSLQDKHVQLQELSSRLEEVFKSDENESDADSITNRFDSLKEEYVTLGGDKDLSNFSQEMIPDEIRSFIQQTSESIEQQIYGFFSDNQQMAISAQKNLQVLKPLGKNGGTELDLSFVKESISEILVEK